jgi:hypothetical protein
MSSEHSLTTNADGRLCLVRTWQELMYADGFVVPRDVMNAGWKQLSWLLNTRRMDGPTFIRWCECVGECGEGYSQISGTFGSSDTATPSSNSPGQ